MSIFRSVQRRGSCITVIESVADVLQMMCGKIATENCGLIEFILDFINVYFDFQHTFCVSIAFGSCVARNTFP